MRFRKRAWRVVFWTGLLVLCSLAGGLWWTYSYYTNSDTLIRLVKHKAPRYLRNVQLDIAGGARMHMARGVFNMTHVSAWQTIDGTRFLAARIPWLNIRHDPKEVLEGRYQPVEVVLTHLTLRLRRRKDGTWNLQNLLADPWPGPPMKRIPTVLIQNGTVELADGPTGAESVAILRDVAVKVYSDDEGLIRFEGTAKGDALDRVSLQGSIDRAGKRITLEGDVDRLVMSETLRKRIPPELQEKVKAIGLSGGELDLRLKRLVYDYGKSTPTIHYETTAKLRSGLWTCPNLPFPINDLSAAVTIRDGLLKIDRAEGYNGSTTVRGGGWVAFGDSSMPALGLHVDVLDLELDERLRKWTPPKAAGLWNDFQPAGRVSAAVDVARGRAGGPLDLSIGVDCLDVSMVYRYFKYPLDHVRGHLDWRPEKVALKLESVVGGKPITATGTIIEPGPNAQVTLNFEADSVPVDQTLLGAMPPDIRRVVEDFRPTGSVRGVAQVKRMPPLGPQSDPKGTVTVDATLDLNERCSISWVDLPYPVENLTGRLKLHPDSWEFVGMRGTHGQAAITGWGKVAKVGQQGLKTELHLTGEKLMFDEELRQALPPAWRNSWTTLNPTGSSDVAATIKIEPGKPEDYQLEITPGAATSVRLRFNRVPHSATDPGGEVELRMDDVGGRFVYDNGTVHMEDVGFHFYSAPVRFERGTVVVKNTGEFDIRVNELRASGLRLDAELRAKMPPVMAQFARRLDDGRTFTISGNLGLKWSGKPGTPVICWWDHALVVFNGNTIQAGVPLANLQGQIDSVRGWSDGERLNVRGALRLESVNLLGQQITRLESPLTVEDGEAKLENLRGGLLGGEIAGAVRVSLDATPHYSANLAVRAADLQRYAMTIPGHQKFRGLVYARVNLKGLGTDLHRLQGNGDAHVTQGDLGEIPAFLVPVKILNLSPATRTAFDSADVAFTIRDGVSILDPIKFTGDAFSLMGQGTLDVQGALDLRLRVLYGRDKMHVLLLSDALREASGQIFIIRVLGTPAYPRAKLEPFPVGTDLAKSLLNSRVPRPDRGPR